MEFNEDCHNWQVVDLAVSSCVQLVSLMQVVSIYLMGDM